MYKPGSIPGFPRIVRLKKEEPAQTVDLPIKAYLNMLWFLTIIADIHNMLRRNKSLHTIL